MGRARMRASMRLAARATICLIVAVPGVLLASPAAAAGPSPLKTGVNEVRVSDAGVCLIPRNADVVCWTNRGNSLTVPRGTPPLESFDVANHVCGIVDGSQQVVCWGANSDGQASPPVGLRRVARISVGASHTCAVTWQNVVKCWGSNLFGQSLVPTELQSLSGVDGLISVSAGGNSTCALIPELGIRCWGVLAEYVPTNLVGAMQLSVGASAACMVDLDAKVVCWSTPDAAGVTEVPNDLASVQQVSVGRSSACAVLEDWSVRCWGKSSIVDSMPSDLGSVRAVDVAGDTSCVLTEHLLMRCWGDSARQIRTNVPAEYTTSKSRASVCSDTSKPRRKAMFSRFGSSDSSVVLGWSHLSGPNSRLSGYHVRVQSVQSGFDRSVNVRSCHFRFWGLKTGETYRVSVAAKVNNRPVNQVDAVLVRPLVKGKDCLRRNEVRKVSTGVYRCEDWHVWRQWVLQSTALRSKSSIDALKSNVQKLQADLRTAVCVTADRRASATRKFLAEYQLSGDFLTLRLPQLAPPEVDGFEYTNLLAVLDDFAETHAHDWLKDDEAAGAASIEVLLGRTSEVFETVNASLGTVYMLPEGSDTCPK